MASSVHFTFWSFLFLIVSSISLSDGQSSSSRPKALILPVSKDPSTLQFTTRLHMGTPLVEKRLVLDLGGRHLWIACDTGYASSTYRPGYCGSASCSVAKAFPCARNSVCFSSARPGCNNNTCTVLTQNTVWGAYEFSEVGRDTISLHSTDGSKAASPVSISNVVLACSDHGGLDFLASGVQGMLGLSQWGVALPTQLSSAFGGSFRRKFAICLPSIPKSNGVLFLGDSPYVFYPSYNTSKATDVSSRFMYTKLHVNFEKTASPRVQGEQHPGYFVKITSILVNKKPIPINSTLLDFHRTGIGGSMISTVQSYSVLESSIYKSLVKAFDKEMAALKSRKVAPVSPFTDCYSAENLSMSPLGVGVPDITLVFENKDVYWDIFGATSVVEINKDVVCLAFLDGGSDTASSIVIGAYQLQDNLLQFDLASSRMAFTSSLLLAAIECSNFKF